MVISEGLDLGHLIPSYSYGKPQFFKAVAGGQNDWLQMVLRSGESSIVHIQMTVG